MWYRPSPHMFKVLKWLRKCLKREEGRREQPVPSNRGRVFLIGEGERSIWNLFGDPSCRSHSEVLFYLQLILVPSEPSLDLWRWESEASEYMHWTRMYLGTLWFLEHSFNKHQMTGLLQTCSSGLSPQLCGKLLLFLTKPKFPHLSNRTINATYLHSCLTANE